MVESKLIKCTGLNSEIRKCKFEWHPITFIIMNLRPPVVYILCAGKEPVAVAFKKCKCLSNHKIRVMNIIALLHITLIAIHSTGRCLAVNKIILSTLNETIQSPRQFKSVNVFRIL